MSRPTVLLVAKRSSWDNYVQRDRDPLILDLLRKNDPTVAKMKAAHEAHEHCLRFVEEILEVCSAEVQRIEGFHQPFSTEGADLVLTVGGDGTLLSASHSISTCPVLGVNSAPGISIGFFCAAEVRTLPTLLPLALSGRLSGISLNRMEVLCNEVLISKRVLNEALLCNSCPAATSRYLLEFKGEREEQRSSGIWIGPAAGSTAAIRSAGGRVLPLESEDLQFVVREPYIQGDMLYHWRHEIFGPGQDLHIRSKMYDGVLFLDGVVRRIPITLGDRVLFRMGKEPLHVLGLTNRR